MEATQYEEIEKQVPAIGRYTTEVVNIETFFIEKELDIQKTTPVFWNHVITLLERVDEDEQNSLETDDVDLMSKEAIQLTEEFIYYLNAKRPFGITEFESYLLTIYFEQLIEGEN